MPQLTPAQRRELRAEAHHLHPVVIVGQHGLTPSVLKEIDVALRAHQLVKVRVFSDARDEREALLQRVCTELDAAAVQHIGKLLVMWRPAPEKEADDAPGTDIRPRTASRRGKPDVKAKKGGAMAKTTPQARRPKSPLARTTRGKTPRAPASIGRTPSEQARRRRGGKAGA